MMADLGHIVVLPSGDEIVKSRLSKMLENNRLSCFRVAIFRSRRAKLRMYSENPPHFRDTFSP